MYRCNKKNKIKKNIMQVRCINKVSSIIKFGKIYNIYGISCIQKYQIINEYGKFGWYQHENFEIITRKEKLKWKRKNLLDSKRRNML